MKYGKYTKRKMFKIFHKREREKGKEEKRQNPEKENNFLNEIEKIEKEKVTTTDTPLYDC